jgi:integrase
MAVRKRSWTTKRGERREAWIIDYVDQDGDRHIETFERKKDADERHSAVRVKVREGTHTAISKSITVAEAAEDWIARVELDDRERSTIAQYRQHIDGHINPRLGREKLATLTTPRINALKDELLAELSRAMAKKVMTSLKSILREAQRLGNVNQNVALGISVAANKRGKHKLKVGIDIPTPDEIKRIVQAVSSDRWRALLVTAIFTGLRASELRGLRWEDVDLKRAELNVRQRADRYNCIGELKSESGERTVPLGPFALNILKQWKLACAKGDLVFSSARGNIIRHENIIRSALVPAQIAAGVVSGGEPKYTGLHSLRHFYASWCINRRVDGGLELPAKLVQERLGHASIVVTLDTYGHLFPRGDDGGELASAERALLA